MCNKAGKKSLDEIKLNKNFYKSQPYLLPCQQDFVLKQALKENGQCLADFYTVNF